MMKNTSEIKYNSEMEYNSEAKCNSETEHSDIMNGHNSYGERIIDMHVHIFPYKVAEKAVKAIGNYYGKEMGAKGTVEDLLKNGSVIGVNKYLIHSTATRADQVIAINDYISECIKENESFIGFGTLHPDLEDIQNEVERIIKIGLKGIKLHPDFQDYNIDDESMMKVYQAVQGRLPILIHIGDENKTSSSPERLARVMNLFPKLTFIAAHLGGYSMWEDSIKYLVGRDLYFDTSSSLFKLEKEKAIDIIRKHGVHKVFFGTDYPMWTHDEELKRFERLELTKEENELILWKNAENFFMKG